jgi:hypothetical protein
VIASSDPLNFILASVWTLVLAFCLWLTWYAYLRWKRNPDDSLSQRIVARIEEMRSPALVLCGIVIGLVIGMFVAHWFWPVEVAR